MRDECQGLDAAWESAMNNMENLPEEYSREGDRYKRRKLARENEQLENEYSDTQNRAEEYLDKRKRSLRTQTR